MAHEIPHSYCFGPFRLDGTERLLFKAGVPVSLNPKPLNLLLVLVEAAGHLKTREELIAALWPQSHVGDHCLTVALSALRKALGDEGPVPRYIQTVHGHGYRFIASVKTAEPIVPPGRAAPGTGASHRLHIALVATLIAVVVAAGSLSWFFHVRLVTRNDDGSARSVAVLRFAGPGTDPTNTELSLGVQEAIVSKLTEGGALRVVSGVSTGRYPGQPADLRHVAHQLNADAVLEGSVQDTKDRVQVNVLLLDARTGRVLWAETYTRRLGDAFAAEDDVAGRVAAAVKARLVAGGG